MSSREAAGKCQEAQQESQYSELHRPLPKSTGSLLGTEVVCVRQDWARLHGYEMHVMAAATDVRIRPGPWQKIAMIRQVSQRARPGHAKHHGLLRTLSTTVRLSVGLSLRTPVPAL